MFSLIFLTLLTNTHASDIDGDGFVSPHTQLYSVGCYDQDSYEYNPPTAPGRWNIANDFMSALEWTAAPEDWDGETYEYLESQSQYWGDGLTEYTQTCATLMSYVSDPESVRNTDTYCDVKLSQWQTVYPDSGLFTDAHLSNLQNILALKYPIPEIVLETTLRTICCQECADLLPKQCPIYEGEYVISGGEDTNAGDWYPYTCEKGSTATHNHIKCEVVDGAAAWEEGPICEKNGIIHYIVLGVLGLAIVSLIFWVLRKCCAAIAQKKASLEQARAQDSAAAPE